MKMKPSNVELVVAVLGACAIVGACGTSEQRLLFEPDSPPEQAPPLATTDASAATDASGVTDASSELTSYCPSSECPAGHASCPNSRFACDVNLLTDRQNCGACGVVCQGYDGRELYECVDGQCLLQCQSKYLNCDGISDNGCETDGASNESCGGCGKKCLDPDKPCTTQSIGKYDCGCGLGKMACFGWCVDVQNDDFSCGACESPCDPTGGGAPVYVNMYYGCRKAQCGTLKCNQGFADCDGDVDTGCEVNLLDAQNCGGCGNACAPGQQCLIDERTARPQCMCAGDNTSFCAVNCTGPVCIGSCADLSSDRLNCGACGSECRSWSDTAVPACVNGACEVTCLAGRADCNGNEGDGCEVNIGSDPRNCGGCGLACNAIAGQACVGGRCVVEPCRPTESDAGGPK